MRILYVTNESPIFPAGGIGTYIGSMAAAMTAAGHDVYLLTWAYDEDRVAPKKLFAFQGEQCKNCVGER